MNARSRWADSLTARVRTFLIANPREALGQADIVRLFGCTRGAANSAMYNLMRGGMDRSRFRIRPRGPNVPAGVEFPASLTCSERRAIEAYAEHGTFKGAARKLGISPFTVADHLKRAREKADAHETVVLVARYLRATLSTAVAA